jgi:hypothetical protein
LRSIQDWIVKRQLMGIQGVVEINSFGGYLKQYEVAVTPERLRSFGIGIGRSSLRSKTPTKTRVGLTSRRTPTPISSVAKAW